MHLEKFEVDKIQERMHLEKNWLNQIQNGRLSAIIHFHIAVI